MTCHPVLTVELLCFALCKDVALTSPEDLEGGVPLDFELAAGVFSALRAVHLHEMHRGIVLLEDAGGLGELRLHPLAMSTPRRVEHD